MSERRRIVLQAAKKIEDAARAGQALDLSEHRLDEWWFGVTVLLSAGRLEAGEWGLRRLRQGFPRFPYAGWLLKLLDLMPPAGAQTPFRPRPESEVQVARREGARTTLVCFAGGGQVGTGVPLPILHRWLGLLDVNLVYLRSPRLTDFYLGGLKGLGSGASGLASGLRALLTDLGAERTLAYGTSSGAFAAIRYGLEVGAEAILALGAPTDMTPGFNQHLLLADVAARLSAAFPGEPLDLRPLVAAADPPPRLTLVYGDACWNDRIYVEHLAGLPGVELHPVDDFEGHHVAMELLLRGEFMALMESFVATRPPVAAAGAGGQAGARGEG